MTPSSSTSASSAVPTFAKLGLRPLINCRGTYTIISGSQVLPQVIEAMAAASGAYVQMDELMEAVGRRLAELTGAEWGYIGAGCAAIQAQVACACIAGADPERMTRLPDTSGMPNEIIMQRTHRNKYDWALRMTQVRLIEVETSAELRAALSDRTALVAIDADTEIGDCFPVEETIAIARERCVPCLVDAAAQRPNVPNRYLAMGADVVVYSGGKCLRGPQSTGFALGRKDLLWAAYLNGAPHHAYCRPMKSGKEEIMGLLAAIEAWIAGRDHDAEWRMWEGYLQTIRGAIAELPSVTTAVGQPGLPNNAPMLVIGWNPAVLGFSPETAHRELWDGEPRITLHLLPEGLGILPYMMEHGDDVRVARRLADVLAPRPCPPLPAPKKPCKVAGDWRVEIAFCLGRAQHSVHWRQDGEAISGRYQSSYGTHEASGAVDGDQICFRYEMAPRPNSMTATFVGRIEGDRMRGEVDLGEYGSATWSARRASEKRG